MSASDELTKLAEWLWSIALRLRLHAHSSPTESHLSRHDAAAHETIARYLRGDRQLALAAFLALVTSRCGHRSVR